MTATRLKSIILLCSFCASACAVRSARTTADILRGQVGNYDRELEAVKKAEIQYYRDTVRDMQETGRTFLVPDLVNLRAARAYSFADKLANNPVQNVTHSSIVEFLQGSGRKEFELYEQQRIREQEIQLDFLGQLEKFDKQSVHIATIQELLLELSSKRQPLEAAQMLADLVEKAQKDLEELKQKRGPE